VSGFCLRVKCLLVRGRSPTVHGSMWFDRPHGGGRTAHWPSYPVYRRCRSAAAVACGPRSCAVSDGGSSRRQVGDLPTGERNRAQVGDMVGFQMRAPLNDLPVRINKEPTSATASVPSPSDPVRSPGTRTLLYSLLPATTRRGAFSRSQSYQHLGAE